MHVVLAEEPEGEQFAGRDLAGSETVSGPGCGDQAEALRPGTGLGHLHGSLHLEILLDLLVAVRLLEHGPLPVWSELAEDPLRQLHPLVPRNRVEQLDEEVDVCRWVGSDARHRGLDLASELEVRPGVVDLGGEALEVGTFAGTAHDAQYGARQLVA